MTKSYNFAPKTRTLSHLSLVGSLRLQTSGGRVGQYPGCDSSTSRDRLEPWYWVAVRLIASSGWCMFSLPVKKVEVGWPKLTIGETKHLAHLRRFSDSGLTATLYGPFVPKLKILSLKLQYIHE